MISSAIGAPVAQAKYPLIQAAPSGGADVMQGLEKLTLTSPSNELGREGAVIRVKKLSLLESMSLSLIGRVGSFLTPVALLNFLKTSTRCREAGPKMLLENHGAVNAILDKADCKISTIPEPLQSIVKQKQVAESIKTLQIYCKQITKAGLQEVVTYFTQLTFLNVNIFKIDDECLELICKLQELQKLALYNNSDITPRGFTHLSKLKKLQYLDLSHSAIDDDGLRDIVPSLFTVTTLRLCGCKRVSQLGIKHLSTLPNLKELIVSDTNIDDLGLQYLASLNELTMLALKGCRRITAKGFTAGPPQKLQELDLSDTAISDAVLKYVAQIRTLTALRLRNVIEMTPNGLMPLTTLPNLQELDLRNTDIDDVGLGYVALIRTLTTLRLRYVKNITSKGFEPLSTLPNVQILDLSNTAMDDAGLDYVAKLKTLTTLKLSDCKVTSSGLQLLSTLPNLQELVLCSTAIDDAGLEHFANAKSLNRLVMMGCEKVTKAGRVKLKQKRPDLWVF